MKSKIIRILTSTFSHLIIIAILVGAIYPIARYYLDKNPIGGVDFYLTITYVSQLVKHFSLPTHWWQYFWYSGNQGFWGYPFGHFYLMLPLVKMLGPILGVQWYSVGGMILFFISSYALFFELAKNKVFALLTSISVAYSVYFYGALFNGGNLPYFNTQFLLPTVLWIIIGYLRSQKKRFLYLAALISGLGFFGHPGVVITFVIPPSLLLLLFWKRREKSKFKNNLSDAFKYLIVAILAGFMNISKEVYLFIRRLFLLKGNLQSYAGPGNLQTLEDAGLKSLFLPGSVNRFLLISLAILFIPWLITSLFKKRKEHPGVIPLITVIIFLILSYLAYLFNLHPFLQGWIRSFWPLILLIGTLNCSLFFSLNSIFFTKGKKGFITIVKSTISLTLTLVIFSPLLYKSVVGGPFIGNRGKILPQLTKTYDWQALKLIDDMYWINRSSAYPYQLNTRYSRQDFDNLAKTISPDWLRADEKNYRFYESDAEVSLGWSAINEIPQARGYIYPNIIAYKNRSFYAWFDIAMNEDNLSEDWGVDPSIALNQSLFLLDWHAVKYIEATTPGPRSFKIELSSYLKESDLFQKDEIYQYQPVIGVVGQNDSLVSLINKFPNYQALYFGDRLDNTRIDSLLKTDALIITNSPSQKANNVLTKYLKSGKSIFIDLNYNLTKFESLDISPVVHSNVQKITYSQKPLITFTDIPQYFIPRFTFIPEKGYLVSTLKDRAIANLSFNNQVVMAENKIYSGKVLWSGINLTEKVLADLENLETKEKLLLINLLEYLTISTPLHYYEIADQHTSPILSSTNAPAIGIIGSFEDYEIIIRDLSSLNYNSQRIIPIYLDSKIDQYDIDDLVNFDALMLVGYEYSNSKKAWNMVQNYVERGGKVFIDTGHDSKESAGNNLPSLFPSDSLTRESLGNSWDLEIKDSSLFSNVDTNQFSPPIYENSPWKFSYPDSGIRGNAKTLLTNHDRIILTMSNQGKGIVLWSGSNLFYHASRNYNQNELSLIGNIVDLLAPASLSNPTSEVNWISPRKREIQTKDAKAILFKESNWPGWQVRAISDNTSQKIPVYSAGPSYPGFIYAPLPKGVTEVKFTYSPSILIWLTAITNLLFILFIFLDLVLFDKRLIWSRLKPLVNRVKGITTSWWNKED